MREDDDGGGLDRSAASAGLPVDVYPGLRAGDFAAGEGVLGIAPEPQQEAEGWGPDAGPKDPTDIYEWMRRLGDQGIAYRIKDGEVSVFTTPEATPNGPQLGAVRTVEAFDTTPSTWGAIPRQDLRRPVYQDLDAYREALGYLGNDPASRGLLGQLQGAGIPTVMIPDGNDRFDYSRGARGLVYWDPSSALGIFREPASNSTSAVVGPVQSPALGLLHEFGHAGYWLEDPIGFLSGNNSRVEGGFDTPEEARNISDVETPAAKALGEPVRSNHGGYALPGRDPTWHTPMRRR